MDYSKTIEHIKNWRMKGILTLSLLCLTAVSCDDFLDKPLQGALTQASFPVTAADALAATNAMYYTLREPGYHTGLFPIDDIMSDDAYKGSNPQDAASTLGPYDRFQHTASDNFLSNWWNILYGGIRSTNVVLDFVPGIDMDAEEKDFYLGQAYFLRGLYYFDLVKGFGGVPLITDVTTEIGRNRNTAEEVYAQIESDLQAAIERLPLKSEIPAAQLGRATKGAAGALLAKVHLFQQEYEDAAEYALEVINSNEYSLEPNFEDANSVDGEHGVESVFEIGAIGEQEGIQNGANFFANVQGVRGTPNRGWGFNRPSLELMDAFTAGDTRLEATVIYLGEELDGVVILGDGQTPDVTEDPDTGEILEIEVYNQKVWTPGTVVAPTQGHNRRIIRYADVLLMAAEALNEIGQSAEALIYLNEVRERARGENEDALPDIVTTDQAELRDIIYDERRLELALEGHRYWDLLRTDRAVEVLGPLGFQAGKHELLPIPQTEIDLTQGSLEQNPNWE